MVAEVFSWIGIVLVLIFSRTVTTLIHELGHAIPSLIFTPKEVTIYVGSYGNIKDAWTFRIGRLAIILRLKILELHLGLCRHTVPSSMVKQLMIIFGGPLFSLLLGLVCLAAIHDYSYNSFLTISLTIFLVSGIFDFFTNILPDKNPLPLYDGTISYNDGYQFLRLLKMYRYPESYFRAMDYLAKEETNKGIEQLEKTIESGIRDLEIYKLIMHELVEEGQIQKALEIHEKWGPLFKLDSRDLQNIGDLYLKTENPLQAIQYYSLAIEKNYLNAEALFSRGSLFYELGYPDRARDDLKKVTLMQEGNMEAKALYDKLSRTG